MKKNYLFTLVALLLGSTIANAQKPLDGYEAPSFTAPGNCGKVISLSTSGALENYTDLKDLTTGKIEQELFVAPGAKVEFSIKITTFWGRFAIFTDANSSKEITRLLQCGVPGANNPYNDETNGVLVHAEDNPNPTPDGTLPSITIPQDAAEGTVYLFRMIFTTMDDINTYAPSFKEGIYHDIKITVKNNIQRYTINIATPENGTLTIKNGETPIESGAQVPEGTVLSVAATPLTGYELVSIKNNDEIYASETFVASADANFAAQFKKLASTGDAMLMSAPGYGEAGDRQLRFSDTVLGSHNTDKNQVESDQRSRNYTFSAWISPMGYNRCDKCFRKFPARHFQTLRALLSASRGSPSMEYRRIGQYKLFERCCCHVRRLRHRTNRTRLPNLLESRIGRYFYRLRGSAQLTQQHQRSGYRRSKNQQQRRQ